MADVDMLFTYGYDSVCEKIKSGVSVILMTKQETC